jgi:hypothetical protein
VIPLNSTEFPYAEFWLNYPSKFQEKRFSTTRFVYFVTICGLICLQKNVLKKGYFASFFVMNRICRLCAINVLLEVYMEEFFPSAEERFFPKIIFQSADSARIR